MPDAPNGDSDSAPFPLEGEMFYFFREQMNFAACPPDRLFLLADKEAWIYDHGNVAELVFVK